MERGLVNYNMNYSTNHKIPQKWGSLNEILGVNNLYLLQESFNSGGLVFDSSILFIKFHNYSKVHFNKKSFRIVKSKIEMIDVDFIKVDKTD